MQPISIQINGETQRLPGRLSIQQLLESFEMPTHQVAVELNFQLVPREAHPQTTLSDGDQLEIVSLAGGG